VRNLDRTSLLRKFRCHPLIYTRLEFDLVQNVDYGQRFPSLGNELPQTGHTVSVSLIIRLALHLEHFTGWSLTRLISIFFEVGPPCYGRWGD
jgi:hypothetical protein